MLKALDGAYVLRDLGAGTTEVTYRLAVDVSHPDDRHAQAQGREGHHRHRAEGPEEARRVARLSARRSRTVRILLFTGKGGVGKTTVAAGTAALAAAAGHAHAGAVHRRRALARRRLRRCRSAPSRPRWPTDLFVQQVDAQRRFEQSWARDPGLPAVGARRRRGRPDHGRGADRHPRRRGGAGAARAAHHALSGEWDVIVVDCAPDGRDAAAARAARGARLVHDAGASRSSAGSSRRSGRC